MCSPLVLVGRRFTPSHRLAATGELSGQGHVGCPEEIAFRMGYIDAEQVLRLAQPLTKTSYGQYLLQLLQDPGRP